MNQRFARLIDIQARWVADWLYSRSAFVGLVYGTLGWIPLVVLGVDRNGFIYLYIATSLSLITQNPLAMLAKWAAAEARRAEENQIETMKLLVALAKHLTEQQDELDAEVGELLGRLNPGDDKAAEPASVPVPPPPPTTPPKETP